MTITFNDNPPANTARLLDFTNAEIRPGFVNDTFFLVVSGKKPYINMEVKLIPFMYVMQPDYWEIEVVGLLPPIDLPTEDSYTASIPIDNILGKNGIEIIGATKRQKLEAPK